MKYVKIAALLAFGGMAGMVACGAEPSRIDEDDDDKSSSTGQGGSGGIDLTVGPGSGGGNTSACSDPTCVGNTPQGQCDGGLAIDSADAMDGARAMGLCKVADATSWGVLSAEWVRSDGQPLVGGNGGVFGDGTLLPAGKGILTRFGNSITPREGAQLLALSSGSARNPGEPDYRDPAGNNKDTSPHGAPPGYPKESPSCPNTTTGLPYDSAGLRLAIRTPTDAKSFQFEFNFYTYEYPDYVCDTYNDFFVAMLSPTPSGLVDGNISFDSMGNTISVNAGFLEACTACNNPNQSNKNFGCSLGYSEMVGTGFDTNTGYCDGFGTQIAGSGSTSWLVTTAPVENPGSDITLHFAIWDSGDGVLDSTVLIDNFRFELEEGQVGTVPVPE